MFTITSYSAFRSATRLQFEDALEAAQSFAAEGGLPSTITEPSGGRWTVQAGALPECQQEPTCNCEPTDHWREDDYGTDYRVDCGCPCTPCSEY